jgi:hypothetical protein
MSGGDVNLGWGFRERAILNGPEEFRPGNVVDGLPGEEGAETGDSETENSESVPKKFFPDLPLGRPA